MMGPGHKAVVFSCGRVRGSAVWLDGWTSPAPGSKGWDPGATATMANNSKACHRPNREIPFHTFDGQARWVVRRAPART